LEREIYRQFPPPKPNPEANGSAKSIAAGEKAGRGKSPVEVKEDAAGEVGQVRLNGPDAILVHDDQGSRSLARDQPHRRHTARPAPLSRSWITRDPR